MKNYYLILIVSSLSILYFIPNIYPENDIYPYKHGSLVTFSDFQYANIFLDYNKMLKVVLTNSSFEKDFSNKTEIQNDVNDIISKLSPLMTEKDRVLLHDFLIDLSEDIKNGVNNDTSYMKWIKKQIDIEGINAPLSNALVFLSGRTRVVSRFFIMKV